MLSRQASRLLRLFGSGAGKPHSVSSHSHDSAPHGHDSSSHGHDSHSHGHDSHSSHKVPEGSWHRHSDDVDPYYWYNKYGPFQPGDNHNIPEDDPYRNEVQGYIVISDPNDDRISTMRGYSEYFVGFTVLILVLGVFTKRHFMESDFIDKRIGDALVVSQEIEDLVKEVKEINKRKHE